MNIQDKRTRLLRDGDIKKTIIYLAIPSIIGMVVNAIYNIVDTIFVGRLGTEAVGAVGIVFPLYMLIASLGIAVGMGAASYISRSLGRNEKEEAEKTAANAVGIVITLGTVLMILTLIWLEPILRLFGSTETILPQAIDYAQILIIGSPIVMLKMALNNILRAEGSAHASMIALILGALLNIILDPIFIFSFGLGIRGAAIATMISQTIAVAYQLWYYFTKKSYLRLRIKNVKPSFPIIIQISIIGFPLLLTQGLNSIAMMMINIASNPFGNEAIAAMGIVKRVMSLAMFTLFGFSQGFLPVAGFNYGAKNFKRLAEATRFSIKVTTIFTIYASILLIIFSRFIISWFSNDQEVIDIGSQALRAYSYPFPLLGFQMICFSLFQALGKAIPAGLLSISRQGILLIPLVLLLPRYIGLDGVIYAQPIADALTIVMTALLALIVFTQIRKEFEKLTINKEERNYDQITT